MRRSLAFVGIAAIAMAVAGFWGRAVLLAAPPLAPNAPAMQMQAPAAVPPSTRAATVAAGDADPETRPEVLMLLRARDFARLTRLIEAKQASVDENIRREPELQRVLAAFETADATLTPLIDAWVAGQPDSYAPLLARAEHRISLAWERRGTKLAKDTTAEQFRGMETHLAGVIEDAGAALAKNARLGEAYRMLIVAARGLGEPRACLGIAGKALAQLPASMSIREALGNCLLPRWGGSHALLEAMATQADSEVAKNPALAALHGWVEWDRGDLAENASEAVDHFTRALAAGEHSSFYVGRAKEYRRLRRYEDALADVARALALAPEEPAVLMLRARSLRDLGRHAEAAADVRYVAAIDATNPELAKFTQDAMESAAYEGYQLIQARNWTAATTRLTSAIELTGGNAQLHYWRGRAYLLSEDHTRALPDFERAIAFDARHFDSYQNIDFILAKQRDWDGVIRHWTQYIEQVPADGRGYLERGGAHRWRGDHSAAIADVAKACQLGTQQACDILARERAQ